MTIHIIRNAEYQDTGVQAYKDNPFIEALPPIQEPFEDTKNLISKVTPTLDDLKQKRVIRAHNIHQITGSFFQPLAMHMLLSERISLMIRGGYVGRNPNTGKLQQHLQNGYERLQTGDLNAKRGVCQHSCHPYLNQATETSLALTRLDRRTGLRAVG